MVQASVLLEPFVRSSCWFQAALEGDGKRGARGVCRRGRIWERFNWRSSHGRAWMNSLRERSTRKYKFVQAIYSSSACDNNGGAIKAIGRGGLGEDGGSWSSCCERNLSLIHCFDICLCLAATSAMLCVRRKFHYISSLSRLSGI